MRSWPALLFLSLALAACVPGDGAVEEGMIVESTLPPPTDAGAVPDETAPSPETSAAPETPVPNGAAPEPASDAPTEDALPPDAPNTDAPDGSEPPAPADPPLLARQRAACAETGGQLSPRGNGFYACVRQTRDGGEQCDAASDCEGLCLARSGTCAPLQPLFGCHEVFTLSGRRETLCTD